jgi:hypothetical protein
VDWSTAPPPNHHGVGRRVATETIRERLGALLDEEAAPTWWWWLGMAAVWCAVLVAVAGASQALGSPGLLDTLVSIGFCVLAARTATRLAGRFRWRYGDQLAAVGSFARMSWSRATTKISSIRQL